MDTLMLNVSWLGVVVGAVGSFLIGWLWYSPKLFGPKWADGVGVEMGTANEMPVGAMVSQMAGLLLMSWLVGVGAASGDYSIAILATLAFVVLAYSGALFAKKPAYARNVEAGYWLVSLVVMIVCQGFFSAS